MTAEGMKRTGLDLVEETGSFVMPGDEFQIPDGDSSKLILGPGLKLINNRGAEGGRIVACKPGVLTKIKGNTFFVLVKAKQYDPYKKDDILGVIKQKGKGDQYSCDVGTRERAHLSKFAFEGATKRFKPDLQVGDVVYGKVVELPSDFPMEITCVHGTGKASGLGSLEGGHVIKVPVHFTRLLRSPSESTNILKKIGRIVPCETAVGVNGMVWVKAKNAVLTLLVSQLVIKLSNSSLEEHEPIMKQFRKGITSLAM